MQSASPLLWRHPTALRSKCRTKQTEHRRPAASPPPLAAAAYICRASQITRQTENNCSPPPTPRYCLRRRRWGGLLSTKGSLHATSALLSAGRISVSTRSVSSSRRAIAPALKSSGRITNTIQAVTIIPCGNEYSSWVGGGGYGVLIIPHAMIIGVSHR